MALRFCIYCLGRKLTLQLCRFDDRSKLPYINRIVQETLRWGPAAPLGSTHLGSGGYIADMEKVFHMLLLKMEYIMECSFQRVC